MWILDALSRLIPPSHPSFGMTIRHRGNAALIQIKSGRNQPMARGGGSANLLQIETVLDSLGMLRRSARKITVKNCTDCANKQTSLGQDL